MALSTADELFDRLHHGEPAEPEINERAGVSILGRDDHGQRTLVRPAGLARLGGVHHFRKRKGVVAAAINLRARAESDGSTIRASRERPSAASAAMRHFSSVTSTRSQIGSAAIPAAFSAAIKFRCHHRIGLRPSDNLLKVRVDSLDPRLKFLNLDLDRDIGVRDRRQHAWLKRLEKSAIDLGKGKRMLVKGGRLDRAYQITVPEDLDGVR